MEDGSTAEERRETEKRKEMICPKNQTECFEAKPSFWRQDQTGEEEGRMRGK